jgi:hypothetical protein
MEFEYGGLNGGWEIIVGIQRIFCKKVLRSPKSIANGPAE